MIIKTISYIIFSLFFMSFAHAKPTAQENYIYYEIQGQSAKDLRKQLNEHGPTVKDNHHYDAQVSWNVNWSYSWYNDLGQKTCQVTNVIIKISIKRIMPKWANEAENDKALQSKWDNYLRNLNTHEEGHATNGMNAAIEIEEALMKVPAMPNCALLKEELNKTAYQIIKTHNAWDVDYDEKTHHGKTQGAKFP